MGAELGGRSMEHAVFLPRQYMSGCALRGKRDKAQTFPAADSKRTADADSISQPCFYQQCRIAQQVMPGENMQLVALQAEPARDIVLNDLPPRQDQRHG